MTGGIFDAIREGLRGMQAARAQSDERWLRLLAKWNGRLAATGAGWTVADFGDAEAEYQGLRAAGVNGAEAERRCAALDKRNRASLTPLLRAIEAGTPGLEARVRQLVADGADVDGASLLNEVPLGYARYFGQEAVFDLLIALGANPAKTGFGPVQRAVRYGDVDEVRAVLPGADVLGCTSDAISALEEAVLRGEAGILPLVIAAIGRESMLDPEVTHCLLRAVVGRKVGAVEALLAAGADPHCAYDELTQFHDRRLLRAFLAHGAEVARFSDLTGYCNDPMAVLDDEGRPAIVGFVQDLRAAGWKPEHLEEYQDDKLRYVTGACLIEPQDSKAPKFAAPAGVFFGTANPEEVTAPYHLEMVRTAKSTHAARQEFGKSVPQVAWSAERFGQSTTPLPDGRWVQIGGVHGDPYDRDFVIFNDVLVHGGQGGLRVFFYPLEVFATTDFHSATLVGDTIWVIGNLSYMGRRRPGETPVMRLDLRDFSMAALRCFGEGPGWISRHRADLRADGIEIAGGRVWDGHSYREEEGRYRLDLITRVWSRVGYAP